VCVCVRERERERESKKFYAGSGYVNLTLKAK
jgi:hypothetical protein